MGVDWSEVDMDCIARENEEMSVSILICEEKGHVECGKEYIVLKVLEINLF
jgi:hypothetical protein